MKGKIGVFDSGFGGLTILKEIVKVLPKYDYVYLGDSARAPYGSRSQAEIYKFTRQGVKFLFEKGAEIVILACNSASSEALRKIQHEFLKGKYATKKVLGVIVPAAEAATVDKSAQSIAVIGTEATIASGAFRREILKINPEMKVYEIATPLLAPLVEEGMHESYGTKILIKAYMEEVMRHQVDALILGCTHYRILEKEISKHIGQMRVVSEGEFVAKKLKDYLHRHTEISQVLAKNSKKAFYTTDSKARFDKLGTRFFGKRVSSKKVNLA